MLNQFIGFLIKNGFSDFWANFIAEATALIVVSLISIAVYFLARRILLAQIEKIVFRTEVKWDDAFFNRKVFRRAAMLFPGLVFLIASEIFISFQIFILKIASLYLLFIITIIISAALDALNDIYETYEISKERPIKGYLQVAMIVISAIAIILGVSILSGQSPLVLIGGLSALTAVLLLVFKDTLLGFIASIQFAMNDMVRIGDWIEMPKYGADGDVIDIAVNTVKVQNWDKTITTIPTYMLVSDSFKNWRGMVDSGGRRIKRSLNMDITSVRFLTKTDITNLKKINIIKSYLEGKEQEIRNSNAEKYIDSDDLLNSRKLTNIGTFRAYILAYLESHPMIRQDMTLLVRQLSPTETGLPIEIYAFSADQDWIRYEAIQSDIFDHLYAIMPEFDLRPYQYPGKEIQAKLIN